MRNRVFFLIFFCPLFVLSQNIDRVEMIVGDELVLRSDIETEYLEYIAQTTLEDTLARCNIINDILYRKMLVHHARLDSIQVSEDEVNEEADRRISSFISQLGSKEAVQEYFGSSISKIKNDIFDLILDQLLSQRMQSRVVSSVLITPKETKEIFEDLKAKESLPLMPTQYEILEIVKMPEIKIEARNYARNKLMQFRSRIKDGEDFSVLATLYSDDIESAKNGGELGFVGRGAFVPNFERSAFALKKGEVSEIIETKFGYHILQLIDRKDDMVNVRHILIKPKVASSDLLASRDALEDIKDSLNNGEIDFLSAVSSYSDHVTKNNNGLLVNPATGSSMFTIDQLPLNMRYVVENLDVSQISSVISFIMDNGTQAYKIIKINKRIEEHILSLDNDYSYIQDIALNLKKKKEMDSWFNEKMKTTYVRLAEKIEDCVELRTWK